MDDHDTAFDGAMEYDGEDGRSFLGEEFDASSDSMEKGYARCTVSFSMRFPWESMEEASCQCALRDQIALLALLADTLSFPSVPTGVILSPYASRSGRS